MHYSSAAPGPRELLVSAAGALSDVARTAQEWDARVREIQELSRLLDGFGIDGASLIRFGFSDLFVGPVLGTVAVALFLEARDDPRSPEFEPAVDVTGWRAALGIGDRMPAAALDERVGEATLPALSVAPTLLRAWVTTSPFEQLIRMTPPTPDAMASTIDAGQASAKLFSTYTWLVERTIEPNLEVWSRDSLHVEYQLATQSAVPAMPQAFLDVGSPNLDELAHKIARRASLGGNERAEDQWVELLSSVHRQARHYLDQSRHVEAAALFEFLLGQRPTDAIALNSLGFCLLPIDPARADRYFVQAQEHGYAPRSLLLYNRMCCAVDTASMGELLFAAERYWVSEFELSPSPSVVWRRKSDGTWAASDTLDSRIDLLHMAIEFCGALGRHERLPTWNTPEDSLAGLAGTEAYVGPVREAPID